MPHGISSPHLKKYIPILRYKAREAPLLITERIGQLLHLPWVVGPSEIHRPRPPPAAVPPSQTTESGRWWSATASGKYHRTTAGPLPDHHCTTTGPPPDHHWTTTGPPSDHSRTTAGPPLDHHRTTTRPQPDHRQTTAKPSPDHHRTTTGPPPDHRQTTTGPPDRGQFKGRPADRVWSPHAPTSGRWPRRSLRSQVNRHSQFCVVMTSEEPTYQTRLGMRS